jgi:transposase InsO family protein
MPWKEVSLMSLRWEFVTLARQAGVTMTELCRRYQISPKTGYKWLKRYAQEGPDGLQDRSRRPHCSPGRSNFPVEQPVVAIRDQHPAWGARKIAARLQALGALSIPAASTIHAILRRQGRIDAAQAAKHQPWQRFEQEAPNQLWQMDFKGHFALGNGQRCHPLTVLDDHSRFALGLEACHNQRGETVEERLVGIFRRYGLPERILVDNGSPWGDSWEHPYTRLGVWLLRLGIGVCHGRPYHPQTQGKDERFHRTVEAELLRGRVYRDEGTAQHSFDQWRDIYNQQRPHQALGMAVPASRYQASPRPFPEGRPPIEYGPEDQVRKVQEHGQISFKNRPVRLSKAFRGYPVALRPILPDGVWEVYFCAHKIAQVDLRTEPTG